MPLSRSRTRLFVAIFVAVVLGLSVVMTVLILHGMADDEVQERVRRIEAQRGIER